MSAGGTMVRDALEDAICRAWRDIKLHVSADAEVLVTVADRGEVVRSLSGHHAYSMLAIAHGLIEEAAAMLPDGRRDQEDALAAARLLYDIFDADDGAGDDDDGTL